MSVDEHLVAAVQRLLAEQEAEQGITVVCREQALMLSGEVESSARRDEVVQLVVATFPGVRVHADIGVTRTHPPDEPEELR